MASQRESLPSTAKIFDCARCQDSGIVIAKKITYLKKPHTLYMQCPDCQSRIAAQAKGSRYQALFDVSGLDKAEQIRLRDLLENGPGTKKNVSAARRLMKNGAGFLTLWGTPGNGKTMILQAIVTEYIVRDVPAIYITAHHMLNYIRAAYDRERGSKALSAQDRLTDLESVPVLCIDEIDKIPMTQWEFANFSSIINERSRGATNGRSITAIAMNRKPHDFLDDHFISRFLGLGEVLENNDNDWRVKPKK